MKTLKNTHRTLIVAFALIFSLTAANNVKAEAGKDFIPVAVKYVGTANNAPVFQLSFSNEQVETFAITIKNKENTIYFEKLKGTSKTLLRKYQFINESGSDNEDEQITIEVRNVSTNKVVTYTFNVNEASSKGYDLVAVK
ncbi:hypothetical protein LK994_04420 [Ferruginibacter lapsinanis]|uniref:hypothetical protein n=1 Tax=Ferruginibacter lapsinanis TaxID=563172 RepID=UPI001E561657|nr:hypothetical protein [Ferruginibacter lapsinanis]UEG50717.1 hypothetical protein LK994_04420 [Ferruginibacter lapsinanis]